MVAFMALGGMKDQLLCMQTQDRNVFRFSRQMPDRVFPCHCVTEFTTFCIIILVPRMMQNIV